MLNFPFSNKKEAYRKVFPDVDTELRKLIMEGVYIDSLGNKMRFARNGEVTNFKAYAYYTLVYDVALGIDFDALVFFDSKGKANWNNGDIYRVEISNETIQLIAIETNWETLEHHVGSEKVILRKGGGRTASRAN